MAFPSPLCWNSSLISGMASLPFRLHRSPTLVLDQRRRSLRRGAAQCAALWRVRLHTAPPASLASPTPGRLPPAARDSRTVTPRIWGISSLLAPWPFGLKNACRKPGTRLESSPSSDRQVAQSEPHARVRGLRATYAISPSLLGRLTRPIRKFPTRETSAHQLERVEALLKQERSLTVWTPSE